MVHGETFFLCNSLGYHAGTDPFSLASFPFPSFLVALLRVERVQE